jgi:hypothetical protein
LAQHESQLELNGKARSAQRIELVDQWERDINSFPRS